MIITIIMIIKQNSLCSLKNKRTQSILFKNKKELLELLGNAHDTLVFLTFFLSPFGWKLSLIQAFPEEILKFLKRWNWCLASFFSDLPATFCFFVFSAFYLYYWYISHKGFIWVSLRGRRKKVRGGEREKSAKGKEASGHTLLKLFITKGKGHYGTIGESTTSLRISFSFS